MPATFYYDLASPYAYLTAQRLARDARITWQPVLAGAIFGWRGRGSWADTGARAENVAEIERRAGVYGLPGIRWPEVWPANTLSAMRAALWASRAGRGREFALAAYGLAFVDGEDVGQLKVLQRAAGAAGLDGDALPDAIAASEIKAQLREATTDAYARGVTLIPSVEVDGVMFRGDDHLEEALDSLVRGQR